MPRLKLRKPTPKEVFKTFYGSKSRIVAKHIQENLGAYRKLNPEDVRSKVLASLGENAKKEMVHSVNQTVFRLRQKGVLPKIPKEDLLEFRSRMGKRGMQVRYGRTDFKSEVILKCVNRQLANGVDSSEINAFDTADILQKEGKEIYSSDVSNTLLYLRKKGKLKPLSQKARARVAEIVNIRNRATKLEMALSKYPPAWGSKSVRIRTFVSAILKLGFKPSEISPRKVFNELKDKIPNLTIDDVYTELIFLQDKQVLPKLTPQERYRNWRESLELGRTERGKKVRERRMQKPEQAEPQKAFERIPVDRREKIRQLMEARDRMQKTDRAILAFQKSVPELEGVGDSKVFYTILRYLMNGTEPHSVAELMQGDGFKVGIIDVASVAHRFTSLLEQANSKELSNVVSQTKFWDTFSFCRDILASYVLRFDEPIYILISKRLKALGQRL